MSAPAILIKGKIARLSFTFSRHAAVVLGASLVIAVMLWQAFAAGGAPDPATKGLSPLAMILSTGVLVFREGLEAILVLAAVTAGMTRGKQRDFVRAVPLGAFAAFIASIATWFIVVAVISKVSAKVSAPELAVQAATGLLAIVVLLVIMNWFFHKVYWTRWIVHHSNRKRKVLEAAEDAGSRPFLGLALLGFTAIYREGFEIVLFLQNLRLRAGDSIVLKGAAIGLSLTVVVAVLTFIAHKHLPYKKMLVYTGLLLAMVLLVMVGESVQEMQQAGWIASTPLRASFPGWLGIWFSVFPNVQSLTAQALAGLLVFGSYFSSQYLRVWRPSQKSEARHISEVRRTA
jgi:high-affinity iron transporter